MHYHAPTFLLLHDDDDEDDDGDDDYDDHDLIVFLCLKLKQTKKAILGERFHPHEL